MRMRQTATLWSRAFGHEWWRVVGNTLSAADTGTVTVNWLRFVSHPPGSSTY
jgi:hypothetical protein